MSMAAAISNASVAVALIPFVTTLVGLCIGAEIETLRAETFGLPGRVAARPRRSRGNAYSPGAPQTGNQRDSSGSMLRSSPMAARTCSSRAMSRFSPGSGAKG